MLARTDLDANGLSAQEALVCTMVLVAATGGGISDVLKGGLGGLLAGGAAGSVLSGGLGDLLNQFQQKGHGDAANSWVSNGPNKQITPGDLASAQARFNG